MPLSQTDIDQKYLELYEAAERDGSDCFWCCGGGDEWRAEIVRLENKLANKE